MNLELATESSDEYRSFLMDSIQKEILTERQVSDWLGLSQPTLSRHRRYGTGPAFVRLSARRVGYRRTSVETWLNELEQQASASGEAG